MPASSPVLPQIPRIDGRCEAASSSQAALSEMQARKAGGAWPRPLRVCSGFGGSCQREHRRLVTGRKPVARYAIEANLSMNAFTPMLAKSGGCPLGYRNPGRDARLKPSKRKFEDAAAEMCPAPSFIGGMTVRQMAFLRSTSEPRRFRARMHDPSNPAKAIIAYWD